MMDDVGQEIQLGRRGGRPKTYPIFISYSHEDSDWLKRLQIMLKPLTRNRTITIWDDTHIRAGGKWRDENPAGISGSQCSGALGDSQFPRLRLHCRDELSPLLEAAEAGGLDHLLEPLAPSLYRETVIADYRPGMTQLSP